MQIYFQIFDSILRNFVLFLRDFNRNSSRKEDLRMVVLKSEEKGMENVRDNDQF